MSNDPYAPPPYPQQPSPDQAYGAQPYPPHAYPAAAQPSAPQTDGLAVTSFVLAICSWFVLPVILAIVALVLASSADKAIAGAHGAKTGEGLVRAAKIISWLNLLLFGLAIVFLVAFLIGLAVGD